MSKKVLIMFGIGLLLIIASLFVLKHEVKESFVNSEETEQEEEATANTTTKADEAGEKTE